MGNDDLGAGRVRPCSCPPSCHGDGRVSHDTGAGRAETWPPHRPAWSGVLLLFLALLAGSGCEVPPEREAQDLLPYLQMPKPDSMTIQWRTSTEQDGAVRYGPTPSLELEVSDPEPDQAHSFTLVGLRPDTEYSYQAYSDGREVGEIYTFRTAPGPGARPFRFALVGDTMYSGPEKLLLKERILEDEPSFVIHLGDFAAELGGYQESLWREYFFDDYADLLARVPLIPILGNHEYQGLIMVFFSIPGAAPLFHDYFTLPNNGRWYSFDWANCHFLALDANIPQDLQGGEQIEWLEEDLRRSTDGEDDPDWIFACWHEPAFSSGMGQFDLMGEVLRGQVVPLMEAYGVDVVFYGHDHFYERSYKDGVYYILSGGGGAAPHPILEGVNPHSQLVMATYQYMRVAADGRSLTVEAVDPLGTILDTFTLEAPPPSGEAGESAPGQGGCGCSVLENPGLSDAPVVTMFLLTCGFYLWYFGFRARRK